MCPKQIQDGGRPPSWQSKMWYFRNGLTNFDKIWHSDASRVSRFRQPIKFKYFKNPRWRTLTTWLLGGRWLVTFRSHTGRRSRGDLLVTGEVQTKGGVLNGRTITTPCFLNGRQTVANRTKWTVSLYYTKNITALLFSCKMGLDTSTSDLLLVFYDSLWVGKQVLTGISLLADTAKSDSTSPGNSRNALANANDSSTNWQCPKRD